MQPWHPRVVSAAESPVAAEWPRSLWHQLLVESRISLGSRVLVIGCRHPEIVAYLDECSFDVEGVDDQPVNVTNASRVLPSFDFTFARLDLKAPAPPHEFDLVLMQESELYRHNLLDVSTRLATARLLSCLKPRGQMAVIRRMEAHRDVDSGHEQMCWTKHFSCFPGCTEVMEFADAWWSMSTWNWLRGKSARGTHAVIRHEPPLELIAREKWIDYVRRAASTANECCCAWAQPAVAAPLRRAA